MKKFIQKHWLKTLLLVLVLVVGIEHMDVLAQGLGEGGSGLQIAGTEDVAISGDIDKRPLGEVVLSMVNFFIGFLGFLAVIMFVYAGVLWVTSGGNDEQITKAKKIMTYAALGIIVVILSFSIVRFITSSAGGEATCATDNDCPGDLVCNAQNLCELPEGGGGATCQEDIDCGAGFVCTNNFCAPAPGFGCTSNLDCLVGEFCDANTNTCVAESGGPGETTGGPSEGVSEDALDELDETVNELGDDLEDIGELIDELPQEAQDELNDILDSGTLADKMAQVNSMLESSDDPAVISVLEQLLSGLQRLLLLREQMDKLRLVMPESEDSISAWDETSNALDDLIDDPKSSIKLRRFENMYRELKDLIRKFPLAQSRIKAAPGQGNVPFTVTFDGLNSVDPTGGTISDYKWSFLDSSGNQVSLGNSPVVIYEFTEANTYSVRLQVSTSNLDSDGYKQATDGVSFIRIKADPPSSQVAYRINGVEVQDVHHVTLEEAKAGIAFDPSITVPAIGRTIEEYEWLFGDTKSETRTVPATVIHSYSQPDDYFVTLRVKDSQGITDKKIVKLTVKSLAADIELVPEEGNVNTEFRFRGEESRSDDGIITDYEWQINDSSGHTVATSQQENFFHTFDSPGTYTVELLVTDSTGAKDKAVSELKIFSRKPIASFDYTIPELSHPNRFEFDASSSYDPDQGDKVSYSWDFDGDGQFEIVNGEEIRVSHQYIRTGTFKVNLQVEDFFGQRASIVKNVQVDSVLSGDIVMDKKAVQVGEEVTFKANSPNAVAYLWEFGDTDTMSTEDDEVTHVYNKEGKYRIKLNFFDRDDNDNSDTSFVLVGEGDSPIAAAEVLVDGRNQVINDNLCGEGISGYVVTRSDNLSFTARNSVNRDGSSRLLTYDWKFDNGTRNSRKDFTHRFAEINQPGQCSTASLVVRDDISGKVSNEDTLYFKVINKLPNIIDFVVESDRVKNLITPTKVRLKVVGARDEDGQIKKYKWWHYREGFENERLGVHSTSFPETEMIITAQGQPDVTNKFFFAAEVTDNDGGVFETAERFGGVSFLEVTNGPNLSPVAEFTVDKTTIAVGDSITFLSQSYDPQGDILPNTAFQWDFDGDGAFDDTSSGPEVNRQFNTPGEFEVRLKVIHRGLSSTARRTVFVEPTNSYPQAAFTYAIDGNTVRFNGDNSAYDPDITDNTLRYEWDFDIQDDANGNGINDDDVQSTDVSPSFTYSQAALYRVRLLVKDNLGDTGVVVRDVNLNLSAADRERNTYKSLGVDAPSQPLTILNLTASPFQISKGETADISATVQNADNSVYNGSVFFEVLEGTGQFTPNPVRGVDSKASTVFSAIDSGPIRIRVTATETYYGDISEEFILNVQ